MELLIVLGVIVAGGYFWYVSIIGKRNKALESLSGVDVQLKQRSNLIPNILKIANKMMEHERELMEEITKLRESAEKDYDPTAADQVKSHLQSSEALAGKMGQFMLRMEQYPDIKSDQTMVQAQQTYNEVEAQIAAARRFYNASVTSLNNSVQIFPGNIIASMAGVSEMPFYEADEAAKAPVDADAFLN